MPDTVIGIIGHPVSHSLSPLMHNFAAKKLGIPFTYAAFDVDPSQVGKAIAGIRALGFAGVNVTVPHKEKVLRHLDAVDEEARAIGAVNTIINRNGKLHGANTDGTGFLRALNKKGFDPRGKRVVIIGAGGSARAIGVTLLRAGVRDMAIVNRTASTGARLARLLANFGPVHFIPASAPGAGSLLAEADLVVQTTSLGMKEGDALPIAAPAFRKGQLVYDIIYTPFETRFLARARAAGAKTMNGLAMLVYQGSASFTMWTGKKFPEEQALKLLTKHLRGA